MTTNSNEDNVLGRKFWYCSIATPVVKNFWRKKEYIKVASQQSAKNLDKTNSFGVKSLIVANPLRNFSV